MNNIRYFSKHWWESPKYKLPGLVLMSGGVDSTVLTYYLANKGLLNEILLINYGQATFKQQKKLVTRHAKNVGIKMTVLNVKLPPYAVRQEIAKPGFVPKAQGDDAIKHFYGTSEEELLKFDKGDFAWIEGRNAMWLLHAGMYACTHYPESRIYNGFQFDKPLWKDPSKLRGDTSPQFLNSLYWVFEDSFTNAVDLCSPFLENQSDKSEIIDIGKKLGINFADTYSCEFFPPCKVCFQCKIVEKLGVRQAL